MYIYANYKSARWLGMRVVVGTRLGIVPLLPEINVPVKYLKNCQEALLPQTDRATSYLSRIVVNFSTTQELVQQIYKKSKYGARALLTG